MAKSDRAARTHSAQVMLSLWAMLVALWGSACTEAPTQIVVVVDADEVVGSQLAAVQITTRREGTLSERNAGVYDAGAYNLRRDPGRDGHVILRPADVDDARALYITVTGTLRDGGVVRHVALVRFQRARTLYLVAPLVAACARVTCPDPNTQTCDDGRCVTATEQTLPETSRRIDAATSDTTAMDRVQNYAPDRPGTMVEDQTAESAVVERDSVEVASEVVDGHEVDALVIDAPEDRMADVAITDAGIEASRDVLPECVFPRTWCGTSCIDPSMDAANCGTCGRVCRVGATCVAGVCTEQRSCMTLGMPGCGLVEFSEGTFDMGGDPAAFGSGGVEARGVTVSSFALDRYEVTVARFRQYWEAGHPRASSGATFPGGVTVLIRAVTEPQVRTLDAAGPNEWQRFCNWTSRPADREEQPINCIDWHTALAFCVWDGVPLSTGRSMRLPTVAEWEFAARGVDRRPYPWGAAMVETRACWNRCPNFPLLCYGTCAEEDTAFSIGASVLGVRHLAGNVWEWTGDNFNCDQDRSMRRDPFCVSDGRYREIRGGAWTSDSSDRLRSAARSSGDPELLYNDVGFRCARTR